MRYHLSCERPWAHTANKEAVGLKPICIVFSFPQCSLVSDSSYYLYLNVKPHKKVASRNLYCLVIQMLTLMVDLDDDEEALSEWLLADESEEDESDSNTVAGENAIDRFACALGGKVILPHIMTTVPPMLQNREFRILACLVIDVHGKLCELAKA